MIIAASAVLPDFFGAEKSNSGNRSRPSAVTSQRPAKKAPLRKAKLERLARFRID